MLPGYADMALVTASIEPLSPVRGLLYVIRCAAHCVSLRVWFSLIQTITTYHYYRQTLCIVEGVV
jgi:hypothetical protein